MRTALVFLSAIAFLPLSCVTYREDLNRGQRMYEENRYERALALWRSLEDDADSLSANDQVRYAYLRGMTDYRLGFRADSRHWLAIAKVSDLAHAGALRSEWKERMEQSLTDLNQDLYGGADRVTSDAGTAEFAKPDAAGAGSETGRPPSTPSPSGRCRSNADCPTDQICDGKQCTPL